MPPYKQTRWESGSRASLSTHNHAATQRGTFERGGAPGRAEAAPRSAHTTTPRRNGHSRRAHTTVQGRGTRESGSRAPDGTHDHTATRRARGAHTTVQGMLHTCSFHPTPLAYRRGAWPRHPPAASVIGEPRPTHPGTTGSPGTRRPGRQTAKSAPEVAARNSWLRLCTGVAARN